ncbi:LamG-like jellyroll fold domain-containing protein [Streptomyces sp. NPDC003077]|uniref:LamG-like jellyroll fold domain-containing protein n=1 Tax=Streptomyces sp. NPDC003077 TaxID=3154443 RepID=UPI0033AA8D47
MDGAPATDEARGKAFWHDDELPTKTAEQRASEQAVAEGRRVEIPGLTNESNQVFANSDGTFTVESSPVPERVRKDGAWLPIDTSLSRRADGRLAPKAAQDVVLSGGGSHEPLAVISRDGKTYELGSPWPLPTPKVAGSLAVYEAVRPDVDLVVQVRPDGFTHNLVFHTREAATDPALRAIRFPVKTTGLSVKTSETGSISMVDAGGHAVFSSSAALMWDSATHEPAARQARPKAAPAERVAAAEEASDSPVLPAPGARTAVADVTASADALSVAPDREFLADPATSYPVVIDPPAVSGTLTGWTTLWSNSPSTSFWKTSHALGVGYDAYVDNKKSRSLFQFDTRRVVGKKIVSATFTAYEIWSANCTKKDIGLYRTSGISSGTTWNSKVTWAHVNTVSAAKGFSSDCPDGDVEFDATSAVAYTAKAKSATTTLGLMASEADPIAWKQFMSPADDRATSSRKPRLSITYVSPPDKAPSYVKMSDPNLACSSAANPAVIRDATPRLTATPTSADGSNASLRPTFDLYNYTDGGKISTIAPTTWTAPGTAGTVVTPALKSGKTYRFYAATQYRYTFNGTTSTLLSPYSAGCYFRVDTAGPPRPTVTSQQYPECAGTTCASSPETGSVGMTGKFKISAGAADVQRYDIWLNGTLLESKKFSAGTPSYEISVTPTKRLTNTLRVQTFDAAGNTSATKDYLFKVARPADPVAEWKLDENSGTASANSRGPDHGLTLNTPAWQSHARLGSGLRGNPSDVTYAATSGPVLDTKASFAVSAWVKLNSKAQTTVLQQRGTAVGAFQLYYSAGYDRWVFNRYNADKTEDLTTISRAIAKQPPVLGAWTHLLGVHDAQAKKIRLYVNGLLAQESAFTAPWASAGPLEIGRWGTKNYQLAADVDQVQVWNRNVFPDEVPAIANAEDPATGLHRASVMAQWSMDEASGTVGTDGSGRGNKLSLQPGSKFVTTDDYGRGNVLALDETQSGHATAPSVVDNSGSFTVTGWVNLAADSTLEDTTVPHSPTVASHPGVQRDAFRLWYRQEAKQTVGHWNFGLFTSDVLGGTGSIATSDEANSPTGWVHVAGVFDSARQSMKLYLTGERQGNDDGTSSKDVFQPSGPVNLGRGRRHDTGTLGNQLAGQLDDVRVYAGALSDAEITQLALRDEPPIEIG